MRYIDLIGTPLDHARSPDLLNRFFRQSGEAVEAVKREVGLDDLADYVAEVRGNRSTVGAVVTTPLKQSVLAYLAEQTALVSFLGASNCIRYDEDGWVGANFDGHGFVAALDEIGGTDLSGARVLLVGCGGAGSAIAASLVTAAKPVLSLHDIDRQRSSAFADRLRDFAPRSSIAAVETAEGDFDVVINASTTGMQPGDPSPIPERSVRAASVVADIVTVADTALKRNAVTHGKALLVGDAMVAGQIDLLRRFLLGDARTEADLLSAKDHR